MGALSREEAMYPAVQRWFKENRDVVVVGSDMARDPHRVRLWASTYRRDVDVAALVRGPGGMEVHLAEGKLLARGHSFHECLSQAESVGAYADYLWVFFAADDWNRLATSERRRNEEVVKKRGLGLLIVDGEECRRVVEPTASLSRDGRKVEMVKEQLGQGQKAAVPDLEPPDPDTARSAARTMAAMAVAKAAVEGAIPSTVRRGLDWIVDTSPESVARGWFTEHLSCRSGPSVDLDPFGCYARDGSAAIWMWLQVDKERLLGARAASGDFGTHAYLDNGAWDWRLIPLGELHTDQLDEWIRLGYDEDGSGVLHLAHRVDISGKRLEDLTAEIETAWRAGAESESG